METHVVIVGAGMVGLATAYQMLRKQPHLKLTLLEKELAPALHQSGNNSGVVHSGVYYKPGSLKAQNCLNGRKELLAFCDDNAIPYQKSGKVIVATKAEEFPRLEEIFRRGQANGVEGLEMIGPERLKEIEPHVQGLQAIWVPNCHIIHFPQVAAALCRKIQEMGGEIHFGEKVLEISDHSVETTRRRIEADAIVCCTGLFSDRMAGKTPHRIIPFRGEYYELKEEKRDLVKGLIYPVPDPKFPFLGVHLTRMVDGKVEAGPNAVLALAREGYKKTDFDLQDCLRLLGYRGFWMMGLRYWNVGLYEMYRSFSKKAFLKDLQRLVPAIQEKDLVPGGAGVRAQLVGRNGKMVDDFVIQHQKNRVHVLNAPSPAATASFSIGRQIAEILSC